MARLAKLNSAIDRGESEFLLRNRENGRTLLFAESRDHFCDWHGISVPVITDYSSPRDLEKCLSVSDFRAVEIERDLDTAKPFLKPFL